MGTDFCLNGCVRLVVAMCKITICYFRAYFFRIRKKGKEKTKNVDLVASRVHFVQIFMYYSNAVAQKKSQKSNYGHLHFVISIASFVTNEFINYFDENIYAQTRRNRSIWKKYNKNCCADIPWFKVLSYINSRHESRGHFTNKRWHQRIPSSRSMYYAYWHNCHSFYVDKIKIYLFAGRLAGLFRCSFCCWSEIGTCTRFIVFYCVNLTDWGTFRIQLTKSKKKILQIKSREQSLQFHTKFVKLCCCMVSGQQPK